MNDIENKIIIITGASQGLGLAIATTLAKEKATIIIADIQEEKAKEQAKILSAFSTVESIRLDVKDQKNVIDVVAYIQNKYKKIDVLINNAAIDVTKPLEEIDYSEWINVINVNLIGPFLLSKTVFPIMSAQNHGHIINITSTAAKRTWPNASAYHASKWGLLGFSHALLTEAKQKNIKVTAVVSGGMKTPFILDRFPDVSPGNLQNPENVAKVIACILELPDETTIPEVMVLPMQETSWP